MTGTPKDLTWPEDAADLFQLLPFVVSVWVDGTLAPAEVSARRSLPRTGSPRRVGARAAHGCTPLARPSAPSAVRGLAQSLGLLGAKAAPVRSG